MLEINPQTCDYDLPLELIAQTPLSERTQARLMVLDRKSQTIRHHLFFELKNFLKAGDVLVLNEARVSRFKVVGKKKTGGRVEVIFISPTEDSQIWKALVRPLMKEGSEFLMGKNRTLTLKGRTKEGENLLALKGGHWDELIKEQGTLPLPPYIKRKDSDPLHELDQVQYQTVYASREGSLAAPTAGLHFSESLLTDLKNKGVQILKVLLHVGWGTFKPISQGLDQHDMLPERFEVRKETIQELIKSRDEGKRLIAVGTTATRVLESLTGLSGQEDLKQETRLFIKPGFKFNWVKGLITNFHVPRSTPISLAAAFAGLDFLEKAYQEAVQEKYRFYSYGDAMLVL